MNRIGTFVIAATLGISALAVAGSPSPARAGPGTDGAALFAQRCGSCHKVEKGQPSYAAPNLHGVVGRKAGQGAYKNYSPALKNSGLTWTKSELDAYLKAPMKKVPGTRMIISLPDEAQREAVIDYLGKKTG